MPNKYIEKSRKKRSKTRDISFHYTNEAMVKELLGLLELQGSVIDAGSGKNKVWFNNIPKNCERYECEIEDGCNFYEWQKKVNFVIGNPPFAEGWKFLKKASEVATDGIAFLGSINFFNCLTPKRLEELKGKGFTLAHIVVVSDLRWYGRYYFIVFAKGRNSFFSWNLKSF